MQLGLVETANEDASSSVCCHLFFTGKLSSHLISLSMSFEQKVAVKSAIKNNLERLKKDLTCQVCFRLFREPHTLPCSHSYCKVCIGKLLQTSALKNKFNCPQCRKETTLSHSPSSSLKQQTFVSPHPMYKNRNSTFDSSVVAVQCIRTKC